eukprot:6172201-Pleurochrysis_carterae.AAC.4
MSGRGGERGRPCVGLVTAGVSCARARALFERVRARKCPVLSNGAASGARVAGAAAQTGQLTPTRAHGASE